MWHVRTETASSYAASSAYLKIRHTGQDSAGDLVRHPWHQLLVLLVRWKRQSSEEFSGEKMGVQKIHFGRGSNPQKPIR